MDDAARARWREVQESYQAAKKIAIASWDASTPDEVIQAATATILIEFGKHRPVEAAAVGNGALPALPPAPPACPACGGGIYDNRTDKAAGKLPAKRPDFKCKDCDWAQWPPRKGGAR